ncbi:hypothetical protein ACLMJK_005717 [Lecanora helva]
MARPSDNEDSSSCNDEDVMKGMERLANFMALGADRGPNPPKALPSAQPPATTDKLKLPDEEDSPEFEEFDLSDFTQEEIQNYNTMAEPGQRLQDAVSPKKMQGLMQIASTQNPTQKDASTPIVPSIPRQIALFVRKHPFLEQAMGAFRKSERRQFERDVYDYAEALGLDHAAAKKQVIKARGFCGEDKYDSDSSALQEEIDDSNDILIRLCAVSSSNTSVLPSIEGAQSLQAATQTVKKSSPKKSPYFSQVHKAGKSSGKGKQNSEPTKDGYAESKTPESRKYLKGGRKRISSMEAEPSVADYSTHTKVTDKAAKEARKAEKQAKREAKAKKKHQSNGGALEPQTQEEAHENYLRSNEQDPHEHGETLNQTERQRAETTKEDLTLVEKIRDDVRYVSDKQVDLYEQGQMQNARPEVKDDLKTLKQTRDDEKEIEKKVSKSKDKKRKSNHDMPSANNDISKTSKRLTAAVEEVSSKCKSLCRELDQAFSNIQAESHSTSTSWNSQPGPSSEPRLEGESPQADKQTLRRSQRIRPSRTVPPTTRKLRSHTAASARDEASATRQLPDGKPIQPSPTATPKEDTPQLNRSATSPPPTKRKRPPTKSPYFPKPPTTPKKPILTTTTTTTLRPKTSCIPFPPLSTPRFGLMQETLSHTPFHLLLACIFLNKTPGSRALPVFYTLLSHYPTPAALSTATHADIVAIIQHLGLQNQRARKCVELARAWVQRGGVVERGRRYRVLHYPRRGDGRDVRPGEVLGEGDERVGWEVGGLPGVGAYAIDSWRIFCRDEVLGLSRELPEYKNPLADKDADSSDGSKMEMQKEWTRVLPMDKELRAYLRWRWLRNGWVWDPVTGERRKATGEEIRVAEAGGVIVEGEEGDEVVAAEEKREEGDVVGKGDEKES